MTTMSNVSFTWKRMMNEFDPDSARRWMADNWHGSIYLAAAYLMLVHAGKSYMHYRPPFELKKFLIFWNATLAVFSVVGACYTLPDLISHVKKYGYIESYCVVEDYYSKKSQAFWVFMFHLSKAPELVDTILLILRKRPIIFLHVYHHTTVLLWCWFCYPFWSSPPRWGVAMNYTVHSIMYTYYLARAAHFRLPKFVAPAITTLQIVQFLICVPLNGVALYRTVGWSGLSATLPCDTTMTLALLQQFLYNSYFILFANFFYRAYVKKSKGVESGKKDE